MDPDRSPLTEEEQDVSATADAPAVPLKTFPQNPDTNFEKYSRKTLGLRRYTPADSTTASLARTSTVSTGVSPYTGPWTASEAAHLLRRTGFGATYSAINNLLGQTVSDAVDGLATFSALPVAPSATPINYYNAYNNGAYVDSSGIALGASWTSTNLAFATGNINDNSVDFLRTVSLRAWHWGVYLNDTPSLREKMTLFWYHLIPIGADDIRGLQANAGTMSHDYMALLRSYATGNFFNLMKAIAKSPAMLVYLSGQYSTASAPNENFARELMELFTMGKVPTQNYTEPDIQAAAKIFSGWKVTGTFRALYPFTVGFVPSSHNQTNKTFSSFFGNATINNQTGAAGGNEFDLFFDLLFTQQATTIAKYICRRLYRFFVFYDIDANAEANVITPLANTLVANNWDILPVLKQLFKSEHFFDMANRGVMIKSPVDLLTGFLKQCNVDTSPLSTSTTPEYHQYTIWKYFEDYCTNNLEQSLCNIPDVSGWKAFYQTPSFYQNWINSNTIQKRYSILVSLTNTSGITLAGKQIKVNFPAFVSQFPAATASDPELLVDAIIQLFLPIDLPAAQKLDIKQRTLLNNQVTNSYWTTAWNNYLANPTTTNTNLVRDRVRALVVEIVSLAEYQLM